MSKNINIDTVRNERISQIDEIWNSDNKGSNARISFTTNIISDVSKKHVVLSYVKGTGKNATTIKFDTLNQINNANVRGFIQAYKHWLGVDKLDSWSNKTPDGKARLRILRDGFICALPIIKTNALIPVDKCPKQKQFTGNNNSRIWVNGIDYVAKYKSELNSVDNDKVALNFSELMQVAKAYYNAGYGDDDINKNNAFTNAIVSLTTKIQTDIGEDCKNNQPEKMTKDKMVVLVDVANKWVAHLRNLNEGFFNKPKTEIAKTKKAI